MPEYPAPPVITNLKSNLTRCAPHADAVVEPHIWGELEDELARAGKGKFDRVVACDCLWMPWQHDNLRRSIAHFLANTLDARAWVIGGFHTGREKMRGFFDAGALAAVGLEIESIWERDCDGIERRWVWDRRVEDITLRKRWLAVAILRRLRH